MLIEEFSFGNFRSFKDIQTLRMSAAKIKSKNKQLDIDNVIAVSDKTKLIKSKVIYGANASGKSNIVKAMFYSKIFISQCLSLDRALDLFMESYKYSTETMDEPCFFQMIFHIDGVKYRYGFEASDKKIHSEWLYLNNNVRETPVFIRDEQNIVEISKQHLDKGYEISQMKNKLFTEKVLFLSLIETFGDSLATKLLESINSIVIITNEEDKRIFKGVVNNLLKDHARKKRIIELLKIADMGIADISIHIQEKGTEQKEEEIRISSHILYDRELKQVGYANGGFELTESEGTKQLLNIGSIILEALDSGSPVIIDEFGSQLHPLLTKKIFSMFNHINNNKAQIIAVSHSTDLMSSNLLRKDQIDFVEKDKYGRSFLYTLVEMKGIRNTASFKNDYFEGKYGGIPFLGNWEELINICNETKHEDNEQENP